MKKIAVVYKSKYGATQQYAEYIAKELNADIYNADTLASQKLTLYDIIIWGGGIYAGKINGVDQLKKFINDLTGKQIIIFSVGFTPIDKTQILQKVRNKSFTTDLNADIHFYHFTSGINYMKLSFLHKAMLASRNLIISLKPKASLTQANIKFLKTYGKNNQAADATAVNTLVHDVLNK